MRDKDNNERVSRQGSEAWQRLSKDANWSDWLQVGEALQVGRELAMNKAETNKPEGKGYNTAFGEWLIKYKLDTLDKGARSRLFDVMAYLPEIEKWRQTLTLTERLKLNNPHSVLRRWKASTQIKTTADKSTLRDSVIALSEENHKLKELVAKLETENAALRLQLQA